MTKLTVWPSCAVPTRRRCYTTAMRCWPERKAPRGDEIRWRYFLEGVLPKRSQQGFDDLESLLAFLQGELADGGDESR